MHFGIAPKLFSVVSYYPVECDFFILLSCQVKKERQIANTIFFFFNTLYIMYAKFIPFDLHLFKCTYNVHILIC